MTITQLKTLNKKNGGNFFERDTMQWFGDTLKNFGIEKITANTVRVYRKRTVRNGVLASWVFNSVTGRMIVTASGTMANLSK